MSTIEVKEGRNRLQVPVNQGAPGTTVLAAGQSGKRHKVIAALLSMTADGTLEFRSGSNPVTGPMKLSDMGGFAIPAVGTLCVAEDGADLSVHTTGGAARGVVTILTE
jgi:hypothetical protein